MPEDCKAGESLCILLSAWDLCPFWDFLIKSLFTGVASHGNSKGIAKLENNLVCHFQPVF